MNPSTGKLKLISIIIFVLALSIAAIKFLPGFFNKSPEETAEIDPSSINSNQQDTPIRVSALPAFTGDLIMRVSATGLTRALKEIVISPKVSGQVIELSIKNGDYVKKGSLLMRLDDREYLLAYDEAKDLLLGAQAKYGFIKRDYKSTEITDQTSEKVNLEEESSATNKMTELNLVIKQYENAKEKYQIGKMTKAEFDKIKLNFESTQIILGEKQYELRMQTSGMSKALIAMKRAELNLAYSEVKASYSGYIADLEVAEGQQVSAGKECFKLLDLSQIEVNLQVLESEIGKIKTGRKAKITFPAFPGETFTGEVVTINPVVDTESKATTVTVKIRNPNSKIFPGMFAYAKLESQILKDKFLVPKDAILIRDQRKLLFVVREDMAKWCYVTTGIESEEYVEILDSTLGLKPGELVIVDGHYTLVHDARVKVEEK